jgi:hypothetical protein
MTNFSLSFSLLGGFRDGSFEGDEEGYRFGNFSSEIVEVKNKIKRLTTTALIPRFFLWCVYINTLEGLSLFFLKAALHVKRGRKICFAF